MSKTQKVLLVINAILILFLGTLFFYGRSIKKDSLLQTQDGEEKRIFTPTVNTGKDYQVEASFGRVAKERMEIILENGKVESFLLPGKIFYLCLPDDENVYRKLKESGVNFVDLPYFIEFVDIVNKFASGEQLELFLYEYSQSETFVKGVVSLSCS